MSKSLHDVPSSQVSPASTADADKQATLRLAFAAARLIKLRASLVRIQDIDILPAEAGDHFGLLPVMVLDAIGVWTQEAGGMPVAPALAPYKDALLGVGLVRPPPLTSAILLACLKESIGRQPVVNGALVADAFVNRWYQQLYRYMPEPTAPAA